MSQLTVLKSEREKFAERLSDWIGTFAERLSVVLSLEHAADVPSFMSDYGTPEEQAARKGKLRGKARVIRFRAPETARETRRDVTVIIWSVDNIELRASNGEETTWTYIRTSVPNSAPQVTAEDKLHDELVRNYGAPGELKFRYVSSKS